jgi:hypothetical protein
MDDEQTTSTTEPGPPADQPIAVDMTAAVPAAEQPGELEEPGEPQPEPEADPAVAAAPAAEQLSLDQMVESLKEPDGGDEVIEASADEETPAAVESPVEEPTTAPAVAEVPEGAVLARSRRGARLPFWVLAGVWVTFASVTTYLLWADAAKPFTGLPLYTGSVLGGVGLTLAGPLLGIVLWLILRREEFELRGGLVRALLLRASVVTLAGNLLWWAGLVMLDMHRIGVF